MAKHFDKQFKLDAVQYHHDHRELGLVGCASNKASASSLCPDGRRSFIVIAIICHPVILKDCINRQLRNCWQVRMRKTHFNLY